MGKPKFVQISEDVSVNVSKMLCLVKGESGEYRLSDIGGSWDVEEAFLPGVLDVLGVGGESPRTLHRRAEADLLRAATHGRELARAAEILREVATDTRVIDGVEMLFRMAAVLRRAAAQEKSGE